MFVLSGCGESVDSVVDPSSYTRIHITDGVQNAETLENELRANIYWAGEYGRDELLPFMDKIIQTNPSWGSYSGVHAGSTDDSDHYICLQFEIAAWPASKDDLLSYCASVGAPSEALFVIYKDDEFDQLPWSFSEGLVQFGFATAEEP